ncbi:hypothetical protein DYB37_003070 [Aphanomyces astaci]|uniref:Sugar phosphate transporter domain-containing protein n=1 Tax=Aphanomyces astaci TaxID=112090 RepID=A0A3R7ALJ3_APHAT|nr:hypothetical protein DYB35_005898 [Aphanomyces astaci]RHZ22484.1 hypothetical protein DYB37_003070 [Aphanomyces astaci]
MTSDAPVDVGIKTLFHALWPCAVYLCLSLSMNIFTKTIITTYKWNCVYSLAAIQHLFTVVTLTSAHKLRVITLPAMSAACFFQTALPMAALHSINNIVGFVCMGLVNMPIYVLVLAQNCCTALNLILAKQSTLAPLTLVYVHSTVGVVVCGPLAVYLERAQVAHFFSTLADPMSFCALFAVMSIVCLLYQVAIHVRTSPLATSVTGNIKDLASTGAGYALFADVVVTWLNVLGVAISFMGAYGFSYVKYHMMFKPQSSVLSPWWPRRFSAHKLQHLVLSKPKAF